MFRTAAKSIGYRSTLVRGSIINKNPLLQINSINNPSLNARPFITVVQKYLEAYRRYGWRECLWRLYNPGDIKFGKFVGEDRFGNKYYEDVTEVAGQQRWCEYHLKSTDPYDASQIPPEWHAWMHQMTDAKPGDAAQDPSNWSVEEISTTSHAPYKNHVGPVEPEKYTQNLTGFHQRGYGLGSIMTSAEEGDKQWMQPNHPLKKRKRPVDPAPREPVRDHQLK